MIALRAALLAACVITAPAPVHAAGACPPGALGTSRVLEVDTSAGLRVGTKSYPATLPLADHEIILTFDDGPGGTSTDAVLAALAQQCVRATFFIVGEMAAARPDQLRRIAAAGHTVAHHSMTHVIMNTIPNAAARADMSRGWQTVDRILYGKAGDRPATPFFRYPGFAGTPELDRWLDGMGVGIFGADFWGSDWTPIASGPLLAQTLQRIEARGSGILLLHDIHDKTAAIVPALLAALKQRGYRIVHIVPKGAARAF